MDELTLHKPVGYKPDIAAREAFANSYVSNYVPKSVFEHQGRHLLFPPPASQCDGNLTQASFTWWLEPPNL